MTMTVLPIRILIEDRAVSQPRSSYAVGTGLFIVLGFAALAYLATQTSRWPTCTRATATRWTRISPISASSRSALR